MKKTIFGTLLFIISFLLIDSVSAGNISLNGAQSVTVGNRLIVSVKSNNIYAKYSLTSSNSSILSGGISLADIDTGDTTTYTFTAKAPGVATIKLGMIDCAAYDDNGCSDKTLTVRVNAARQLSTNNNLSSLGIETLTLSPEFNSDTLEYTAVAEAGTNKINVTGSLADQYASISGIGEKEVVEGDNNIEVVVTAENGSTKTYVIKLTVKEFNPIKVKIGNKDYTVVRNKNNLTPPTNYEEKNVKIKNEEVPAYYNDITKYTIVSLKDDKGVQNWYVKDKDKYTLYKEIKFGMTTLYPMDLDKIPDGYNKTKIKYNKETINSYKTKDSSKYALIYGMNVETGEKHIYMYDSKEDTVQIYNDELINKLQDDNKLYLKILIGLSVGLVLSIGIIIFILLKNKKKNI